MKLRETALGRVAQEIYGMTHRAERMKQPTLLGLRRALGVIVGEIEKTYGETGTAKGHLEPGHDLVLWRHYSDPERYPLPDDFRLCWD